jgi:hypothetical protein
VGSAWVDSTAWQGFLSSKGRHDRRAVIRLALAPSVTLV